MMMTSPRVRLLRDSGLNTGTFMSRLAMALERTSILLASAMESVQSGFTPTVSV